MTAFMQAGGRGDPPRGPLAPDFSELFAESARAVMPRARDKGLVTSFDYFGPDADLDIAPARLRTAMERVLGGIVDLAATGFVMFRAEVIGADPGSCVVVVTASATGSLMPPDAVESVLARLALGVGPAPPPPSPDWQTYATGICPATGAFLSFVHAPDGIAELTWTLPLGARRISPADPRPDAGGALAWLVCDTPGGLDSVARRLHERGWSVRRFGTAADAIAAYPAADDAPDLPLLVIAAESAAIRLPDLEQIARRDAGTWTVMAGLAGTPLVQARDDTLVDIRLLPMSSGELDALTWHVDARTSTLQSRHLPPRPRYVQDRRRVLVADDSRLNLHVAAGMLHALGYDAESVADGAQAVVRCLADPPDLVLTDIHMPRLDGLGTARCLRDLQAAGRLPPFPIIASSTVPMHAECLAAGIDLLLTKPLSFELLENSLHRFLPTHTMTIGLTPIQRMALGDAERAREGEAD